MEALRQSLTQWTDAVATSTLQLRLPAERKTSSSSKVGSDDMLAILLLKN